MPEERKVICPCGKEMTLCTAEGIMPAYRYIAQYHCGCGWTSPVRDGTTEEEAIEAAYEAATRRPPNQPLTREQVEEMDDNSAVYFVHGVDLDFAYGIDCDSAKIAKDLINRTPSYYAGHKGYFFDAAKGKPTPADIEAARTK